MSDEMNNLASDNPTQDTSENSAHQSHPQNPDLSRPAMKTLNDKLHESSNPQEVLNKREEILKEHDDFQQSQSGFIHDHMNAVADGVAAIAMTILVLEIQAPASSHQLGELVIKIGLYIMSFVVIANFYFERSRLMAIVKYENTPLIMFDFMFMLGICLIPLFTKMMFEYPDQRYL